MHNSPLETLSTTDLQFCRVLTDQYKLTKYFIEELSIDTYDRMKSHIKSVGGTEAKIFGNIISTAHVIEYYSVLMYQLQKNFITQLEEFISLKYRITFDSFISVATPVELSGLESFEPIIENIARQLGSDFKRVGVDYLLSELRNMLVLKQKPRIEERSMIFQESFSYDLADGKLPFLTSGKNIEIITKAISIYVNGNKKLFPELEKRCAEWESHFHFNKSYVIGNAISVQFTPDKCFQLTFPDNVNVVLFYFQFMIGDSY